jgi:hypothetical protein
LMEVIGLFELIEAKSDGLLTVKVEKARFPEFLAYTEEIKRRDVQAEKMLSDPKVHGYVRKRSEIILRDREHRRSTECSSHYHAHVTELARLLNMPRDQVYLEVLLLAVESEVPPGGSPYPYVITKQQVAVVLPSGTRMVVPADVLVPKRTSGRTNKEMMTAIEAAHEYARRHGAELTETPESWESAENAED